MKDAKECIQMLLNMLERLNQENLELKKQLQQLKDEINLLKGEQPKPNIKPNKNKPTNHSSEKKRNRPKKRKRSSKIDRIITHETRICPVEKSILPSDAIFKGHERATVQDINFEAHNILFLKEKYYSPSQNKTFLAPLPPGYEGEFGPNIKTMSIKLYFDSNMTQPKILDLYNDANIFISAGQLSNFLIKNNHNFHKEKDDIYEAGLRSSPWQHIDDTRTRVNGNNQYCQIVCNPLYTAYFTTENKTRLTVIDVLRNFKKRFFLLNDEAFCYINMFRLPTSVVQTLRSFPSNHQLNEEEFFGLLNQQLPKLGP